MRAAAAALLLAAAVTAVLTNRPGPLLALVAPGLVLHFAMDRPPARAARRLAPVFIFGVVLTVFERLGGAAAPKLALRMLAVFVLVTAAGRLIGWEELLEDCKPGSALFGLALFLLLVRHFARVLAHEVWRRLLAWRLEAPRRWRRGWFSSLTWAVAGIFERALVRAERFYAAQHIRGIEP